MAVDRATKRAGGAHTHPLLRKSGRYAAGSRYRRADREAFSELLFFFFFFPS